MRARLSSTEAQRLAFYRAAKPLLQPTLAYLDARPLSGLEAPEQRLLDLVCSLAHVALAVEQQGDQEGEHALAQAAFTITRASEDFSSEAPLGVEGASGAPAR
jgi:hypothetical protein